MTRKMIWLLASLAFTTTACGLPEDMDIEGESARAEQGLQAGDAIVWDNECFALVLPANDDGSTGRINLPFQANFFGQTHSSLFINNNGNVTFNSPMSTYTPFRLEAHTPPIIAPFLADVDTRSPSSGPASGLTRYSQGTVNFEGRPAFCVSWVDVGYFSMRTDKLNTFQLLLVDRGDTGPGNFDIVMNYSRILWETGSASGGTHGLGGSSAGAGFSAGTGDPSAYFQFPGSLVNGALLDSNTETGLIHHSRNSSIPGRYIFNVRNGRADVTAPVSTATVSPSPDANGEHHGPVSVSITAADDGSGVASITYVLSGATEGTATVSGASASLPTLINPGVTTITYSARDEAGNVEAPRTLTVHITQPCMTVNLDDFNLFLLGDYTGGHDMVGKVAVGGDITLEHFAVGSGLAPGDIDNVLVAGGNLNMTHGAVYGNAFYGGSTTANQTVTFMRGTLAQGSPIDFAARGAELRTLSAFLGGFAANGTTTRQNWGGIFLQGSSAYLNVFDVNASDFTGAAMFNIDAPAGSFVVVNIRGASASFSGFGISFSGGINQNGVLYNFVDATSITAGGFGFWGTVLAPSADISFSNGSFDGGIYARSLTGNAEGHINPLTRSEACR